MTQTDKDLLLKDLCARLPYGVKVLYDNQIFEVQYIEPMYGELKLLDNETYTLSIEEVKPYLFPFSSMTEEQKQELNNLVEESVFQILHSEDGNPQPQIPMDWYNKNHFDYRELIPMGLANDATGLNIY